MGIIPVNSSVNSQKVHLDLLTADDRKNLCQDSNSCQFGVYINKLDFSVPFFRYQKYPLIKNPSGDQLKLTLTGQHLANHIWPI
jgi:hypothetical protein